MRLSYSTYPFKVLNFKLTYYLKLTYYFEIFDPFLITQRNLPHISYTQYVELEVSIKEMMDHDILNNEQWKVVEKLGKTKYILHQ